jgi:hypothetical protein
MVLKIEFILVCIQQCRWEFRTGIIANVHLEALIGLIRQRLQSFFEESEFIIWDYYGKHLKFLF